ncbi:MAG: rhomboid family intramembrane serine protease [Bacteroidia bacterium]|nr:rhomboid family intramembrane serine protease [Bacteroidia bacterium]MDW8016044.1 rhomboid family intramembrane serine protease [Bacteroidia bacterium]
MVITIGVLGACAAASFWAWADRTQDHWQRWGLSPSAIRLRGEWYRFLTSIFFHADFFHLLMNGIVFYSFGSLMERAYGMKLYSALLGMGALGSGLATYLRYRHNPYHLSIGLSGVVNAVLFHFIVLYPQTTLLVWFIPLPAWIFALLYIAYTLYEARRGQSYINHWAHLGGAAAGVLFTSFSPFR